MTQWLLFLLVVPALRSEAPLTSSLGWVRLPGAERCVGTKELARAVEGHLKRGVFVSAAKGDLSVEGRVEPIPGGFRAVVTLTGSEAEVLGQRTLEKQGSCRNLDGPLSLIIALMIDPDAILLLEEQTEEDGVKPEEEVANSGADLAEGEPSRTTTISEHPLDKEPPLLEAELGPWIDLDAGAAVGFGLLPQVGLGVTFAGRMRDLFVEARGSIWLDSVADVASSAARFSAWLVRLSVCQEMLTSREATLEACLGAEAGALRARPTGFELSRATDRFLTNLALRARAKLRIGGPFFLGLGGSLLVPLVRDEFTYRTQTGETERLFMLSAVGGSLDLGLGVEFF